MLLLSSLSNEVLGVILDHAGRAEGQQRLIELALISTRFASIAVPLLHADVTLVGLERCNEFAKYKRSSRGRQSQWQTRSLRLELDTIYPSPLGPSLASLRFVARNVGTNLTTLTLSFPPSTHNPLRHLFGDDLAPLCLLKDLERFTIERGGEVWFDDLSERLLPSWTNLVTLELLDTTLRGDCNRRLPLEPRSAGQDETMPRLRKIVIARCTLTGRMISDLLSNQNDLQWLEMPLPGGTGSSEPEGRLAWRAIRRLVDLGDESGRDLDVNDPRRQRGGKLQVLKVWDRWQRQTGLKKRKAEAKEGTGGGQGSENPRRTRATKKVGRQDDTELLEEAAVREASPAQSTLEPSPLGSVFSSPMARSITSVLLTTSFVSTATSSFETSLFSLLPHLSNIVELAFPDSQTTARGADRASPGFRTLLKKALSQTTKEKTDKKKRGATHTRSLLPNLKELVGVKARIRATRKQHARGQDGSDRDSDSTWVEDDTDDDDDDEDEYRERTKKAKQRRQRQRDRGADGEMSKRDNDFFQFCKSQGVHWRTEHAA
ncbi:hypothetical protein JCM3766R1_006965 [Sporobolomyces carnicolor]